MFRVSLLCGLMPLGELILGFCALYRKDKSKIDAVLQSWLVFWLAILISTELLSLFDAISRANVLFFHVFYLLSAAAAAFCNRKELRGFRFSACRSPLFAAGIAVVLIGTFICGITYAPDNWDSMTYHLTRVASWIQNQNVDFYDTPITRQNYQMPLAEFGILHWQLMTVSDRLAFCVQWLSFLISLLTVFRITQILGGSAKSCWFASFIAAMLPMAFFQASSTQNDLAVASFLCIFARYLLIFTPQTVVWTALAFGLSLMTKGTAYVYAAAIGVPLGGYRLLAVPKAQRKKTFFALLLTVVLGLCCSAGFAYRTLTQDVIASSEKEEYFVISFHPGELLRNLTKHVLLHMAPPYYCTNPAVNEIARRLGTHPFFKLNDRDSQCITDFNFQYIPYEDFIGNFYHFCLYLCCIILMIWMILRKKKVKKEVMVYTLAGMVSFILFGLFLRWNQCLSRLHTAVFLLFAPIPAVLLESSRIHHRKFLLIGCSIVLFFTIVKSGFSEGGSRRFGYPFREGTFPLLPEKMQLQEMISLLKKYDVKHLGLKCGIDAKTYLVFKSFEAHRRKTETMTIDYDCSAPYILSFEDLPESARETPLCRELIAENGMYRLYRNQFAENPASCFPGVKLIREDKGGIRLRQKKFSITLDIPEKMRGKKLFLNLTADRENVKGSVFAGFSVSGKSCRFKENRHQKNVDVVVTIPASHTTSGRLEVSCFCRRDEVCIKNVTATTEGPFVFKVFDDGKSPLAFVFYSGFSGQEEWGRWTDGEKAEFTMNILPRFYQKNLKLTFDVLACAHKFKILADGKVLKEITTNQWENKIEIELPAKLNTSAKLPLTLEIADPVQQKNDPRRLGVGLKSIALEVTE